MCYDGRAVQIPMLLGAYSLNLSESHGCIKIPPAHIPTFLFFLKDPLVNRLRRKGDLTQVDKSICLPPTQLIYTPHRWV